MSLFVGTVGHFSKAPSPSQSVVQRSEAQRLAFVHLHPPCDGLDNSVGTPWALTAPIRCTTAHSAQVVAHIGLGQPEQAADRCTARAALSKGLDRHTDLHIDPCHAAVLLRRPSTLTPGHTANLSVALGKTTADCLHYWEPNVQSLDIAILRTVSIGSFFSSSSIVAGVFLLRAIAWRTVSSSS